MKVSKFLWYAYFLTLLMLVYVWQQSEIFRLGYVIDKRQQVFQEVLDKNTLLRYTVQKDASLIRITNTLSRYSDLQMPDSFRLVRMHAPSARTRLSGEPLQKESILARLLGVRSEAQANTKGR